METSSKSQTNTETLETSAPMSLKERSKLFLKFALVGLVFYYLYRKGLITAESFKKLFASPRAVIICSVLMLVNTLLGALRWKVLLETQGAHLPYSRVLKLNMVGSFFNIALPGAVSGDFIKAIYVAKHFKDKRPAVFGSIFFDRILGVSAMVFVGAFSALLSMYIPWGGSLPPVLLMSIGGIGFAAMLFFIYLFASHKKDPLFQLLRFFTRRHHRLGMVDRLYLGIMGYREHPRRILKAIPLSIAIHIIMIVIAFFITEAISAQPLPVMALAVIVPIGMLATAIPVLPAGVGTGHAAFYALFKLVGSELGAEVFSLFVLYQVIFGIIGGIIYLQVAAEK
ncbi:MAG: flippase-like domain-containing protein [Bdellovibrionales bacterium]|nr:flippase-like domain-containing protein [Oligoflexia bacterium]